MYVYVFVCLSDNVQALVPARLQRGEFSSTGSSLALPATAFQPMSSVGPDKEVSRFKLTKKVRMWSAVKNITRCSI